MINRGFVLSIIWSVCAIGGRVYNSNNALLQTLMRMMQNNPNLVGLMNNLTIEKLKANIKRYMNEISIIFYFYNKKGYWRKYSNTYNFRYGPEPNVVLREIKSFSNSRECSSKNDDQKSEFDKFIRNGSNFYITQGITDAEFIVWISTVIERSSKFGLTKE